jgi:hypothetical protein
VEVVHAARLRRWGQFMSNPTLLSLLVVVLCNLTVGGDDIVALPSSWLELYHAEPLSAASVANVLGGRRESTLAQVHQDVSADMEPLRTLLRHGRPILTLKVLSNADDDEAVACSLCTVFKSTLFSKSTIVAMAFSRSGEALPTKCAELLTLFTAMLVTHIFRNGLLPFWHAFWQLAWQPCVPTAAFFRFALFGRSTSCCFMRLDCCILL